MVFGDRLDVELAALMGEAATDLRANTIKATREEAIAALAREGVEGKPTPLSPLGIRVSGRSTQGVKLIDASDDDLVTSASLIERQVDATDEPGLQPL